MLSTHFVLLNLDRIGRIPSTPLAIRDLYIRLGVRVVAAQRLVLVYLDSYSLSLDVTTSASLCLRFRAANFFRNVFEEKFIRSIYGALSGRRDGRGARAKQF